MLPYLKVSMVGWLLQVWQCQQLARKGVFHGVSGTGHSLKLWLHPAGPAVLAAGEEGRVQRVAEGSGWLPRHLTSHM